MIDKFRLRRQLFFIKRLLRSPSALLNALLSVAGFRFRMAYQLADPVVVDIEPTNACNFRCPHCQVTHAGWVKRTLSIDRYRRLLPMFGKALKVKLQGMGEPFLNRDLPQFIKEALARGHWVEVISNASQFHRFELSALLERPGFDLTVSFDGATREVFEKMRPGSDFDQVVGNMKPLAGKVSAWMVVTQDNEHQVEAVFATLRDMGVRRLGLQFVVINYGKESLDALTVSRRSRVDWNEVVDRLGRKYGMVTMVSDHFYDEKHVCPWPWQGIFVDANENVIPCCRIGDASVMNMGNLGEQTLAEIWNSDRYQAFRRAHRESRIPKICQSCYLCGAQRP